MYKYSLNFLLVKEDTVILACPDIKEISMYIDDIPVILSSCPVYAYPQYNTTLLVSCLYFVHIE